MPGFSPDTSCMVATVCGWHESHSAAREAIERRLRQGDTMLVAGPALIEAYAVLTRLPAPHRLSASDAVALLDANFVALGRLVALDAAGYRTLIRQVPGEGITGGRTYDAVIAACALRGKAASLLTLNEPHFIQFAAAGLHIVVPDRDA
jgi:predicted nucleic acid-binding protein